MTSLYPGTLFYTPGLNRRSTPTKAGTTSEELAKRYKRLPYNGRPWPAPSPVAGVYDISNSSTQLIIMNNKVRKKSKLRGHNDPDQESDRLPNPERHSRNPTPVNKEFHTKCLNSQSPRYTPSVCSELEWNNNSQRSPAKFFDGSPVNPKRHTACRVPSDPKAFQIGMLTDSPRRSSSRLSLPARFQSSPLLTHPELKPGERAYLTHIARIYSAGQMMKLKQAQYNQLLFKEMEKGLYGRDEVERYGRFINMGKDRQYQMLRPATGFRRVMSAPPEKYHVYDSTTTYSNNDDSFSTEKSSSDLKNNSSDEKEGKRPKTVRPKSTRERQLSPRSKTQQAYKTAPEIPPTRTSKGSASKPNVKVNRNQNSSKVGKEEEKKQVSPATTSSDSSSDNNRLEEGSSSHREGVDRPKSRLGHASAKTAAEQKRSESESSGKDIPTDTSTTFQKVPSPRGEAPQSNGDSSYENKRLTPVLENQSSEQNESSDSSNVRKDDGNTSSDESQGQQKLSMEESKGQQRSSDDSDSQKRSSQEENQQRSSDNSEGQQRSSDNSEGQQRSSDNSEGQQRSSSDEEKGQFKPSVEESTGQETSVTEEYSQDDDHNTKSDYTTSEETQPTKSTTENTYTSQRTQEKSEVYSSSATQDITPQDNTESSNEDTYTMTYESSATNQPTDNTMPDPRNLSTEKSSSAEDKTTTNYTDDSKVQQSRRDSLETDDLDDPRRVNKDVDKIEY